MGNIYFNTIITIITMCVKKRYVDIYKREGFQTLNHMTWGDPLKSPLLARLGTNNA